MPVSFSPALEFASLRANPRATVLSRKSCAFEQLVARVGRSQRYSVRTRPLDSAGRQRRGVTGWREAAITQKPATATAFVKFCDFEKSFR
jgi:hypothetical protein